MNKIKPFGDNDFFDFYIIYCEEFENQGSFMFPKQILLDQKIISIQGSGGKLTFRVYPDWVITQNL